MSQHWQRHQTDYIVCYVPQGIFHFQLGRGEPMLHTRLRPHCKDFLEKIAKLYELHVFTFGSRLYAHTIAGTFWMLICVNWMIATQNLLSSVRVMQNVLEGNWYWKHSFSSTVLLLNFWMVCNASQMMSYCCMVFIASQIKLWCKVWHKTGLVASMPQIDLFSRQILSAE